LLDDSSELTADDGVAESIEAESQESDEVVLEPPEDATDQVADAEFEHFEPDDLETEAFDIEAEDESVEEPPVSEEEWNEAHTDEIVVDEEDDGEPYDVTPEGIDETEIPVETEAAVEMPVEEAEPVTQEEETSEPSPFTIGEGDPFGDEVDDQQTPVRAAVEPQVAISAPVVDAGDAMVRAGDNQLHLRLQGTGAIAESGQVRALDIEVPVPGSWVGNRRVTLQLRLTLTPAAEEEDGGPGDTP
jgi:hypothetical protein